MRSLSIFLYGPPPVKVVEDMPEVFKKVDEKSAAGAPSGKQQTIISFSLTHPMGKVGIKTSPGQPEIIRPLRAGPHGFCVADFGQGDEATECANILIAIEKPKTAAIKKDKAKATGKGKKAKGKAKAKAKTDGDAEEDVVEIAAGEADKPEAEVAAAAEEPAPKKAKQELIFLFCA